MSDTPTLPTLHADLAWINGAFARNIAINLDVNGRIASIATAGAPANTHTALLPGLINAHSHAFQRALRGRGETYPAGAGSFWTWRAAMYDLVNELTPETFRAACVQAFREMLAGGFTTVAEFHYLHHANAADRDFAFDAVICEAAREAGIRMLLLPVYYQTGDVDAPLLAEQARFATPDLDEFLNHWRGLRDQLAAEPTVTLGVAAHSLRAVPRETFIRLAEFAADQGVPFHFHIEEQRREIESFKAAANCTPMRWVLDHAPVTPQTTAVHCTHTAPADLAEFARRGGAVCICPITEANLGDGICDVSTILDAGGAICIGSDSNVRIDAFEELRWLELVQRLAREQRGVLLDDHQANAPRLLRAATFDAAAALGLDAGKLEPGALADVLEIDLSHPQLAGLTSETFAAGLIHGAGRAVIREAVVAGRRVSAAPR